MLRLIQSKPKSPEPSIEGEAVDEQTLLKRVIRGDRSAFEVLYKLYYPRLFRFILRTTQQPESIEEIIQETMLLVWNKPERYNHQSKISTWIFGIAYLKALKSMSKSTRRPDNVDVDELTDYISAPTSNLAENIENRDWLISALQSLSVDQRALIELAFYDGLAYQEIAKILDCPENTVKTRMFHARKKLQAFVESQKN